MSRIVNLTGHEIFFNDGVYIEHCRPESKRARVDSILTDVGTVHYKGLNIPLLEMSEQEAKDVPAPRTDTLYVVSGIVAAHCHRADVVCQSRMFKDNGLTMTGALAQIYTS